MLNLEKAHINTNIQLKIQSSLKKYLPILYFERNVKKFPKLNTDVVDFWTTIAVALSTVFIWNLRNHQQLIFSRSGCSHLERSRKPRNEFTVSSTFKD